MSWGLSNTRAYLPQAAASQTPPPPATVLNYYEGGFANAGRLSRGFAWMTGLVLIGWWVW